MLTVRICDLEGAVIARGTCSDSGYFPMALASIYNAGLDLSPARGLESFGEGAGSADYPVGTWRVRFGHGGGRDLDDEVIVHVERTSP